MKMAGGIWVKQGTIWQLWIEQCWVIEQCKADAGKYRMGRLQKARYELVSVDGIG